MARTIEWISARFSSAERIIVMASRKLITTLTLIGWYLIVSRGTDLRVPSAGWQIVGSYDTAEQCKKAALADISALLSLPNGALPLMPNNPGEADYKRSSEAIRAIYPQCIASNDPRLKNSPFYPANPPAAQPAH
jgi:hypothetical protein